MKEKSLWQQYKNFTKKQNRDLLLWKKFDNVIILNKQMKQAKNVKYQNMMYRARHACLNANDITSLNQKIIISFNFLTFEAIIIIVKRNVIRHIINQNRMKSFAIKHKQKIIIFSTHHNRVSFSDIKINELLNCFNHFEMSSTKLFFYIKNASAILLSNLNSSLRLMNECRRYINDIILDSNCKNIKIYHTTLN
jgi:hypothetical protein